MIMIKNTDIEVKQRFDKKYNIWALLPDPTVKPIDLSIRRWIVVGVVDRPGDATRYNCNGNKITYLNN